MKSRIASIILIASFYIIAIHGFVVGPVNNGDALMSSAALSKISSICTSTNGRESISSSLLQMAAGGGDLRRPQEAQTELSGTVQRFTGMNGKGYGFIIPDTGGKNIFFLASAIVTNKDDNIDEDYMTQSLQKGDLVTFDTAVEDDFKDQKGKLKAVNVVKVGSIDDDGRR
mmetsp:Transcript_16284/g.17977  ORF Transcript_16284/g.17977 Transcript_16284/m.17977 type:complete len:171 (-) Transcript_16284:76-588(-)